MHKYLYIHTYADMHTSMSEHTYTQVEYTLLKCLVIFQILDYIHLHNERSWERDPSSNVQFAEALHMLYTWNLKVIYLQFLAVLCMKTILWQGIFHLWNHVRSQKVLDYEAFGFSSYWCSVCRKSIKNKAMTSGWKLSWLTKGNS